MKNIIKKWLGLDQLTEIVEIKNKLEKYKECEECSSICSKAKMKTVKHVHYYKLPTGSSSNEYTNYYCENHKPNYDKVEYMDDYMSFIIGSYQIKKRYYKNNVEVNFQGKPICTKK